MCCLHRHTGPSFDAGKAPSCVPPSGDLGSCSPLRRIMAGPRATRGDTAPSPWKAQRLRSSRWIPVLAGLTLELCGGSLYISGLYTSDLKRRFFTGEDGQSLVEQLVFASNLGMWLPGPGLFNDSRCGGARNTALIAALLTLVGYTGLWAWSSGIVEPRYWQVWCMWFLWGHGSGWFDNAAVTTAAKNFPHQRGRAVALIKAFYGLSGSVLTQVYALFFVGRTSAFLLFLALAMSGIGAVSAPLLWLAVPQGAESDQPARRLGRGLRIVVCLASFLMLASIAKTTLGASDALNVGCFVVTMLFLASLLLLLREPAVADSSIVVGSSPDREGRQSASGTAGAQTEGASGESSDVTLQGSLRTAEFWLVFLVAFTGMGSGLVLLNHVGQMVSALGGGTSVTPILVSSVSVFNCLGRVSYGVMPDLLAGRVATPSLCALNMLAMGMAQLLLALSTLPALFAGSILTGFCYGGFWTLLPCLVMDLFGMSSFASIYNALTLAVCLSSFLFSTQLASRLYDRQAESHPASRGGCAGESCYRATSLAMAATCAAGCAASLALRALARRRRARLMGDAYEPSELGTSLVQAQYEQCELAEVRPRA